MVISWRCSKAGSVSCLYHPLGHTTSAFSLSLLTISTPATACISLQHPAHNHISSMSLSHIFINLESKQFRRYSNEYKKIILVNYNLQNIF
jgi:hypothetical protein